MKKYNLKKEYLFKTVTIKRKSTAITYNLWNLTDKKAEYLFNNGYKYLFEEMETSMEEIVSSEETKETSMEEIVSSEETMFDLFADKNTGCKTCGTQKTKRKYTKKK